MRSSQGAGKCRAGGARAPPLHQDRLRKALSLGLRPASSARKRWWNTDAEVQGQAARAILAFVNASKSSLNSVDRNLLEDVVSALEGLLMAQVEQVYTTAAEATAALVIACKTSALAFGIHRLVAPLAHLFCCPRSSTVASCAVALRIIIDASKPRCGISEDDLWKMLKDADVLNILASQVQKHSKCNGEGSSVYVAIADLLAAILWRWPASRLSVGHNPQLRRSILLQCSNSTRAVSCAALRLNTALTLCGGLALMQIQDNEGIGDCLVGNTNPSKSIDIRIEAFRFLASLSRSPTLTTSISSSQSDIICRNTTDAIAEWLLVLNKRWPPDVKILVLEAAHAARELLHFPGKHHLSFWRAGFGGVICDLLLHLYDTGAQNIVAGSDHIELNRKSVKYHPMLGPILWDVMGWLATHAQAFAEESLTRTKHQAVTFSIITSFACEILLKVVDRRGSSADLNYFPGVSHTELGGISICKAVLLLLFSPSPYLASVTKHGLEQALQQHGYNWLPSFVNKLSLTFSTAAASEDMITVMSLMAVGSLSNSEHCRHQLVKEGVLEVLVKAIKAHPLTNLVPETSTATKCLYMPYMPFDTASCCWSCVNIWEGHDPILFFSLWAFASLARGSDTAKAMNIALKRRFAKHWDWNSMPDYEIESHLLLLAGSTSANAGLRWWASACLACCGAYGFPSHRRQLSKIFNDASSADVELVFADGSRMYAHKVIIATKCPDLLPSSSDVYTASTGKVTTCEQVQLRLSARIREASIKALLEFIYNGFVLVEEQLVFDVKLLAKRCHVETFSRLLQGKTPIWGSHPDTSDFTPALGSIGCSFSDILLEDKDGVQAGCITTKGDIRHLHAHRAILSSQCSYFEGLFRSGMQDSVLKVIKIPLSVESSKKFLHYLYSLRLPQIQLPEAGCIWSSLDREEQVNYLESYVEIAQLAEQWLLEDLKEQCLSVVQSQLKNSIHLGPEIIIFSASCDQWAFVELVAECISFDYPRMRDSGDLDALDDSLVDAIRAAHVRMAMHGNG